MGQEAKIQSTAIKWLKAKGCYVIKTGGGPGTPVGCPDVIALFDGGGWAALEFKASEKSKFQPLQKDTIYKLNNMWYSRVVTPDNWDTIRKELVEML